MEVEHNELVDVTSRTRAERRDAITSEADGPDLDEDCDVVGCCV